MTDKISQQERPVQNLSGHVVILNEILDGLLEVMNGQKEALISSDIEQVEHLTEIHSQLSVRFNKQEEQFVHELQKLMGGEQKTGIRISNLKKYFPEASGVIDSWRNTLVEKTNLIQEKHQHIIQLLEFAMLRNASLMKTIYSIHNEKNTHYSTSGSKENIVSGVALNQKA